MGSLGGRERGILLSLLPLFIQFRIPDQRTVQFTFRVSPPQLGLSQTCPQMPPEVHLLGDSKSGQVNDEDDLSHPLRKTLFTFPLKA